MAVRDALETLKDRLKELDGNLVENTDGFEGKVGEVPMQVSLEDGKLLIAHEGNYSLKSLQAAFNIAEITSGLIERISNAGVTDTWSLKKTVSTQGNVLTAQFKYLDSSWVPKIIDETSYKTGLALKTFLDNILEPGKENSKQIRDELLSFMPGIFKGPLKMLIKENAVDVLFDMQELLNARLAFYERVLNHEEIDKINGAFKQLQQQRDKLDAKVVKPSQEIASGLESIKSKVDSGLTEEELDLTLQNLEQYSAKVSALDKEGENWNKSNKKLPETISINILFNFLELWMKEARKDNGYTNMPKGEVVKRLQQGVEQGLTQDDENINQPIKLALDSEYAICKQSLKDLTQSIGMLQAKVKSAKQAVQQVNEVYEQHKVESPEFKLADSKSDVQVQLEFNKQQLAQFEQALEEVSAAKIKFEEKTDLLDGDETFKQYLKNHVKTINEEHFGSQIESIETSIGKIKLAIEKNEKAIAKSSKQGRIKELATLAKGVNATYRARHQSSAVLSRAEHEQRKVAQTVANKKTLLNQQYEIKVKEINADIVQKNKAIPSRQTIIQETNKHFSKRRHALTESKSKLKSLSLKIKKASSLYDIVGQLNSEELKKWLEIDDTHWLMGDYEQYRKDNLWYGFNLNYASNWIDSKINPYMENYKQKDKQAWLTFIGNKIEFIDKELTVENIDTPVELDQVGIEEGSTFDLQQKYLAAKEEHSQLVKEVEEKKHQLESLSSLKKEKEEGLDAFEKKVIDNANEKRVNYDSAIFTHELAMLRLGLTKLEYLMVELQENNIDKELDTAGKNDSEFAKLQPTEKLTYLDTLKQKLTQQKELLTKFRKEQGALSKEPLEKLKESIDLLHSLEKKHPNDAETKRFRDLINDTLAPYYKSLDTLLKQQEDDLQSKYSEAHLENLTAINNEYLSLYKSRKDKELAQVKKDFDKLAIYDKYIDSLKNSGDIHIELQIQAIQKLKGEVQEYIHRKPVISHFKDALFMQKSKGFREAMPRKDLFEKYSDDKNGLLNNYIAKRKETYWFKDFMSNVAAFFLGFLGYQTESQKRENYVDELKGELESFKNDPSHYEDLSKVIEQGKIEYKPRKGDQEQSLQTVLTSLERELEPLKPQKNIALD